MRPRANSSPSPSRRGNGRLLAGALFLLLLAWVVPAVALNPRRAVTQYSLETWRDDDGLVQSSVQDILQTRDGFLWLATQGGLFRFDGVDFVSLDLKARGLPSNFTTALVEGKGGRLWIGTHGGLALLDGGELTHYGVGEGLPDGFVASLLEDRRGDLWIGTRDGLARFHEGSFSLYGAAEGLPGRQIQALLEDRRGDLWVGTEGGLARLVEGVAARAYDRGDGLPADTVRALAEGPGGDLWVGTDGGLARLREGRVVEVYGTAEGLPHGHVQTLAPDRDGNLWVGTLGGGLARFRDGVREPFEILDRDKGLSENSVWALYEDREGILWIGTLGGGLNRLMEGAFTPYTTLEGLSSDFVVTLLEDRRGALWAGTERGLNRLQDGAFTLSDGPGGPGRGFVWALHEDRRGDLWIGAPGGLHRLRRGTFTHVLGGPGAPDVRAILEARDGDLWVGTWGDGLLRLRDGAVTAVHTVAEGLAGDYILALHEDRRGDLWIGTQGGLSRLSGGVFTTYTAADGLREPMVLALHEDARGTLWIGTMGGGLHRFRDGVFTAHGLADGLFDDFVMSILEDDRGNLWMSSNRGVFRVALSDLEAFARGETETLTPVSYGKDDGMKSAECTGGSQPAGWRGADGRLWFPTNRGLMVVDPARVDSRRLPPPVVIDELMVERRPLPLRSGSQALRSAVTLPRGERDFEVHYTALSFLDPRRLTFRYRLEPFDEEWVEAGTRRAAFYTNVPPGRYRFRVMASNHRGVWNEAGGPLAVVVEPRVYETWWFLTLLSLGTAAAAWVLYRIHVRRLVRRNQELEARVEERTAELLQQKDQVARANEMLRSANHQLEVTNADLQRLHREKDDFLAIVAHDLRGPLISVRGFSAELREDLQEARRVITEAAGLGEVARQDLAALLGRQGAEALRRIDSATGRMDELIASVLKLYRMGRCELHREVVQPGALARASLDRLAYQLEHRHASVTLRPLPPAYADREALQITLDNLLTNAVAYLDPRRPGKIEVEGWRGEGETVLAVRDNGRGIREDQMERVFRMMSRAGHQDVPGEGMGLACVETLIRRHGGRIWCDSEHGAGSTFFVALPDPPEGLEVEPHLEETLSLKISDYVSEDLLASSSKTSRR